MPVWITVATIGATWITIGIIVYGIWKYNGEFYIVEDEPFMVIFGWPIFVFIMSISILRRVANFLAGIIRPAENKPEMSPPPVPPTKEQYLAALKYVAHLFVWDRHFNKNSHEWTKRAFERWSNPDELIDNVIGEYKEGWFPESLNPYSLYSIGEVGYLYLHYRGMPDEIEPVSWFNFRHFVIEEMQKAVQGLNQPNTN